MKKLIALIAIMALVAFSAFAVDQTDELTVQLTVDGQTSIGWFNTVPTFANGDAYAALSGQDITIALDSDTLTGSANAVLRTSSADAVTAKVYSTALANGNLVVPYTAKLGTQNGVEISALTNGTYGTEIGTLTATAGTTTRQVSAEFSATVTATNVAKAVSGTYTATVTLVFSAS
ncbi:MAG: hypothetical protein IJ831_10635 [Spirochaetales bacterium]|nr:hypothetical protein [Spirochaetales bacterium]